MFNTKIKTIFFSLFLTFAFSVSSMAQGKETTEDGEKIELPDGTVKTVKDKKPKEKLTKAAKWRLKQQRKEEKLAQKELERIRKEQAKIQKESTITASNNDTFSTTTKKETKTELESAGEQIKDTNDTKEKVSVEVVETSKPAKKEKIPKEKKEKTEKIKKEKTPKVKTEKVKTPKEKVKKEKAPKVKKEKEKTPKEKKEKVKKEKTKPEITQPKDLGPIIVPTKKKSSKNKKSTVESLDCNYSLNEIDPFTQKRKLATEPTFFFGHTQEELKQFMRGKHYLTCEGYLSKLGGILTLNLKFIIDSPNAQKDYGGLKEDAKIYLKLINNETIILYSEESDKGTINRGEGKTAFSTFYIIDSKSEKKLRKSEVSQIRVVWDVGYEDYDITEIDFIKEHLGCLDVAN